MGGIYIIPGSVLGEAAPFWTMAKVKELLLRFDTYHCCSSSPGQAPSGQRVPCPTEPKTWLSSSKSPDPVRTSGWRPHPPVLPQGERGSWPGPRCPQKVPTDSQSIRCSQPSVEHISETSEQRQMLSGSSWPNLALGSPPRQGEGRDLLIINLGANG